MQSTSSFTFSTTTYPVSGVAEHELRYLSTSCPICETTGPVTEVYPANFTLNDLNPRVFSARRLPDRIHFRLVRCRGCGLTRSDPIVDPALLHSLYAESSFTYGTEVAHLQRTYARYLRRAKRWARGWESLLEIGCGSGFLLEEASRQGLHDVRGVEPSCAAVAQAAPWLQPRIACDSFRPGLFAPESFDVICLLQVFDHLAEPAAVLEECQRLLRPGGLVLVVSHNIEALSARLLGEKSPVIDIEHTFLYSPSTLAKLLVRGKFEVVDGGPVWNSCSLNYLGRLVFLPADFKTALLDLLSATGVGRWPLRLPLGNFFQIARKSV
ncbi:hypothetical protein AYO40_02010 [Planctomycetaceae bacterium SCGC AG-212-D15]|nr:hypothetical protein AYO40_02010 [Planctomycetaceae bacterium SCGC AG-212-D15]